MSNPRVSRASLPVSAARDGSDQLFIVDLLHCFPNQQRGLLARRAISTLIREKRLDAAESVADWCSARIRCQTRFRLAKLENAHDRDAAIVFVKRAMELAGAIDETGVRADAYIRAYGLLSAWGVAAEAAEARTQAAVAIWLSRPGEPTRTLLACTSPRPRLASATAVRSECSLHRRRATNGSSRPSSWPGSLPAGRTCGELTSGRTPGCGRLVRLGESSALSCDAGGRPSIHPARSGLRRPEREL